MDDKTRLDAAHRMGMKLREIVEVAEVGGASVITTHDGQRTLVDATGAVVGPWTVEECPAPPVADELVSEPSSGEAFGELDAAADAEPVPDGTAAEVLAWVGEDPERALRAAKAEECASKPRSGLLAQLTKLAGL